MMSSLAVLQALPFLWLAAGDAVDGPGTVEVRGTGMRCPSPADVAQRIGALLPARAGFQPSDWIELSEVPSRRPGAVDVEVRLARAGAAAPLGIRRIERVGSCSEVADAIAVVAASWLGAFAIPAPTVPALPDPPPEPEPRREAIQSAPPSVMDPRPAPRAQARTPLVARASAEEPTPVNAFAVGGIGGVQTGGDGGMTPVVGIEGAWRQQVLIARLQMAATGARALSFAGGRATWQRVLFTCAAGADLWRDERMSLDFTVGPLLGLTWARSIDFPVAGNATGLDVGVAPAVRFGRAFTRDGAVAWASLGSALWLRNHVLAVDGDSATRALPAIEVMLSVGVTFSVGS